MLKILIISFLLFLIVGVPIGFAMGIGSALAVVFGGDIPHIIIPQRIFVAIDSFPMMAIPLFVLAGELMNTGGITKRIVVFSRSLVGHIRGGLAHVNILASMFFAGISGAAAADSSAIGSMLIPAMVEDGYDPDFSVAVTASSSTIGPIIPPSILMIIYGSMGGLSIGSLFLGGIIPGIMIGIALMLVAYFISVKKGYSKDARASLKQIWQSFKKAIIALIMPFIILGGILSGVFTATEAGVVAVIYGLIIGIFFKEINKKNIKKIAVDSAIVTATTMFVIASAQIMGWILAIEKFPQLVVDTLLTVSNNPTIIMLLILLFLFVLGFFMDGTAAIIILVPVFVPIVNNFGFDPIHFALLVVMTVLVGAITPPVGVLLFINCAIAKIPLSEGARAIWPFVLAMITVILLCAFIPQLVTLIPHLYN